jgi:tetratricopeptide (TPR) repeat protein
VVDTIPFKYRAFLSYSHRDKAWADWLHVALEKFRIDPDLVGRASPAGAVPRHLRPIFRDREDFSAGHSLTEQTLAALAGSQFLIAICSPNAAKSHYVNEEIRHFKAIGRGAQVIAIIVGGEPGDAEQECFPPALRVKIAPDGTPTDEPEEPIAADARPQGDGKRMAILKVAAGLIALPFDDVRKREAIAENRRVKFVAAGVLVFAVLALLVGYLFVEHRHQLALDEARFAAAEKQKREQEHQYQEQQQQLAEIKKTLLAISPLRAAPGAERAVGAAVDAAAQGAAAGDARWQRALALLQAGNVKEAEPLFRAVADEKVARISQDKKDAVAAYRNLGAIAGLADPKRAREAYAQAVALDPDDREALYWHGWLQLLAGSLGLADRDLNRLLQVSTAAQDDRGIYRAYLRLGEVFTQRGNLRGARDYEDHAYDISRRNAERRPDDLEWRRELSVAYEKVGDVQVAQGDLVGALRSYRDSLAIADRLATSDPGNAGWQRDLSVAYGEVGDVQVAQDDLAGAMNSYRDSLAIRERLATSDPGNAGWQRDLSVSFGRLGDVQVAQGDLPGALRSYHDSLAIRERLATSDPGNADRQRDLSMSYANLADAFRKASDNTKALDVLRQGRAIMVRMASLSPNNVAWKRDLAWFDGQIAELVPPASRTERRRRIP